MIGLVYLIVISIWLAITCLMLTFLTRRIWRGIRKNKKMTWDVMTICSTIVTLAWLGASVWYGGGRKYYYNAELTRLCAIDGGARVYETIMLPPEKFEKPRGNYTEKLPLGLIFSDSDQDEKTLNAEYIFKTKYTYMKGGLLRYRTEWKILRKSDGKLLGEEVFYTRIGENLPIIDLPFHCPSERGSLTRRVFILNDSKELTP